MKNLKIKAVAILAILTITSCSNDDTPIIVPPVNEEELITTVTAVFTPVGGGNVITLQSKDLDGDGLGNPVVSISGSFALGKTYNGEVTILDETKTPTDNITEEVQTEAVDHQLFYVETGTLPEFAYTPIATSPTNYDSNGNPLGLKTIFVTTTAATGDLKIILRHEGNKSAPGVSAGDITNATGATDFEVTFTGIVVE
ncbi:type 1 periplasmic binding fold superfamily protein [Flavobacterium sp.]|uniref:type 1 periplasmic binding fold superfamily protein n=1 Tax=Flavobacterium sp. TaxID=239 RepID=UPI00286DEB25|nr:type 1 periplasmic binding fold superfamily protein [Flavobacterium sp.]